MRPLAAVSAGSSAGVHDCLMPHMDRREVFEDEFREKTLLQLKKRGQGVGTILDDPGFAFGVSTQGNQETVKALLSHSQASDRDTSGPRPQRHSQGLRLPPSHVFGRGKHARQYKGGASDGESAEPFGTRSSSI